MPPNPSSMSSTFTRRRALALGGGAVLGAMVGGSAIGLPAHARSASSLAQAFKAAASRHAVPQDLLAAIGFTETRLRHYREPSRSNGFGIMHLVDNAAHRTLPEAAELTGLSRSALKGSARANIHGAAAVLSHYADDAGLSEGDREDLASWYPVLARYSGADQTAVAQLYADAVVDTLWTGFEKGGVALGATPVEAERESSSEFTAMSNHVDYPGARWDAAHSSNYTSSSRPSSYPISYVVIHMMQGTYAGSISWFKNPSSNVSAHYCIRSSDGQITQMVRHSDIAWHAGNSFYNQRSVGIEHEGYFDEPHWYTEEMYRSSAALTRHICDQYGIPKTRDRIIGHNEASSTPCPGQIWDWGRYISYVNDDDDSGDPVWDVVVDATSPGFTAGSSWDYSSWSSQKYGDSYAFNTPEPVSDAAWYSADLPESGTYRIEVWYPANSGYNDRTPYVVAAQGGNQSVHVNQRTGGGTWRSIGTFSLAGGLRQVVGVSRWTSGSGYVIADAVRISLLG